MQSKTYRVRYTYSAGVAGRNTLNGSMNIRANSESEAAQAVSRAYNFKSIISVEEIEAM